MTWRLIYDSVYVIDLFETNDITITPYTIFESKTQDECFNEIDKQQLYYLYYSGGTEGILFSGGTRTIVPIEN
jgi:hypothetical protein